MTGRLIPPLDDITRKRAVLLDAQLRLSLYAHPGKEAAVDSILKQLLFSAGESGKLTVTGIQSRYAAVANGFTLSIPEIKSSLQRLTSNNQIIPSGPSRRRSFQLVEEQRRSIETGRISSDQQLHTILVKLFGSATAHVDAYLASFQLAITTILSGVIEENLQWLSGDTRDQAFDPRSMHNVIDTISHRFTDIDEAILKRGVTRFFSDNDPVFDSLKWNIAQNYYVIRAIGMHEGSKLLSSELFKGCTFFLDTNVLIPILDPTSPEHHAFLGLARACHDAEIQLSVCRLSIDELNRWISAQHDVLRKLPTLVPRQLVPKVRSQFLERYLELVDAGDSSPDAASVFGNFLHAEENLQDCFGIEVIDDPWFGHPDNN